jgi:hypothetical protein
VKKDGRKCDVSDSVSNKKESVKLTLAVEDKEMKSKEQVKFEVSKSRKRRHCAKLNHSRDAHSV